MNFKQKITTTFAASAIVLGGLVPAAYADSQIQVTGNGSNSNTRIEMNQSQSSSTIQQNRADIYNSLRVVSNTGNNTASNNTGGQTTVISGDTGTQVSISNHANMNNSHNGGGNDRSSFMKHFFGHKLSASLGGGQEVPGPGDPDGKGKAKVSLHPEDGKLCVNIHVSGIGPAIAAHIHEAPRGSAGPVVVTLPTPNAQGYASGCVDVDKEELKDIKEDPEDYYVNIHNAVYPSGAVRGQLSD